jgi:hypothetical protein
MRLILILFTGFFFTQELQVEGNLNVTGTIESTTIDSLNQVILDLQNQIAGMQVENRLETRVFTTESYYFDESGVQISVDIQSIIGTEVENALISVLAVDMDGDQSASIHFGNTLMQGGRAFIYRWDQQYHPYGIENNGSSTYTKEVYDTYGNTFKIWSSSYEPINVSLTLAITAQFSN